MMPDQQDLLRSLLADHLDDEVVAACYEVLHDPTTVIEHEDRSMPIGQARDIYEARSTDHHRNPRYRGFGGLVRALNQFEGESVRLYGILTPEETFVVFTDDTKSALVAVVGVRRTPQ